jgi:hypothetical protein
MKGLKGHRVGPYVLDEYVGAGKIGFVYRAHLDEIPEVEHAVKLVPNPRPGWDNELKKVARLSKVSNVVHFHRLETHQVTSGSNTAVVQYTVWDYVAPGRNLRDYLEFTQNCSVSFLFAVVTTILRVLHACEQLGAQRHGDLHTGNILIGEQDGTQLDSSGNPVDPIFVSDFGYGATGEQCAPKDDYQGLATIADAVIRRVDWDSAPASGRLFLTGCRDLLKKVSREQTASEKYTPLSILKTLQEMSVRSSRISPTSSRLTPEVLQTQQNDASVGQFQISEMLGDDWELWNKLFVARVPARSRILEKDITAVVTGPRGCGKTMLFRRLSERLILECGPVDGIPQTFLGLYVNANDISDAFASFSENPTSIQVARLISFLHLCVVSDVLSVHAIARDPRHDSGDPLVNLLQEWFGSKPTGNSLVTNEDPLSSYRTHLEQLKRKYVSGPQAVQFPGQVLFEQHSFLRDLIPALREKCSWVSDRMVFVFLDDYTTPRVSEPMQRVLNRVVFQRSSDFVFKVATEAATTFVAEDSSRKLLQDGDDYKLIDIGEESLFMSEKEREGFLGEVFSRRLSRDPRVGDSCRNLPSLLGRLGMSKTAFARLLRSESPKDQTQVQLQAQLRGAARRKALYCGHDVFTGLWSGDTRLMIQLMQDVVDAEISQTGASSVVQTVSGETQDRAFRNRGGQWLEQQRRNSPTDPQQFDKTARDYANSSAGFRLSGASFGSHLKAIVEAFKTAARAELFGPTYVMTENGHSREVPKMAFRIEITDEFRLSDMAAAIYRDLIRYGLFMRDARGKSIRGAMVPRLYLRRLLLPYCVLPLSKRDSVSMSCEWFSKLLLTPDQFSLDWIDQRFAKNADSRDQLLMPFADAGNDLQSGAVVEPEYDDISEDGDL